MIQIGEAIDVDPSHLDEYKSLSAELRDMNMLKELHLDTSTGFFSDYGYHTESVTLKWVHTSVEDKVRWWKIPVFAAANSFTGCVLLVTFSRMKTSVWL